jgi:hypothetical protein
MVLWRCSRHGVRSGQGGLWVLQMKLKSGWFPVVLGGVMISLWVGRWRSQVPRSIHPSAWKWNSANFACGLLDNKSQGHLGERGLNNV